MLLARDLKRRALFLSSLILVAFVCLRYYQVIPQQSSHSVPNEGYLDPDFQNNNDTETSLKVNEDIPRERLNITSKPNVDLAALALPQEEALDKYHIISSSTSPDGHYFSISFGLGESDSILNPSIIPNPGQPGTWIVVAQQRDPVPGPHLISIELICVVAFNDGNLRCVPDSSAVVLPILPTPGGNCPHNIGFLNWAQGPHDARVLYGPDGPLVVFGSNSAYTCFGLFIQDLRQLVPWPVEVKVGTETIFANGTEMQRPDPWGVMEKNWFVFWDRQGTMYAHFDIFPQRAFARLHPDGSVDADLAPEATEGDEKCVAAYLPSTLSDLESIHQATNSLAVTLCRRADPGCKAETENTFVFTVVQHKTFFNFHSEYQPYVVLFSQNAPFDLYGISSKPLWINGRQEFENGTTSMLYVASVNWKAEGLGYHGYLDDTLFLGFGIEDRQSGAIELLASDLLAGLGLCSDI